MRSLLLLLLLLNLPSASAQRKTKLKPVLNGTGWQICKSPDWAELAVPNGKKPEIVDHSFVRRPDGKWILWACIRYTSQGRVLYGWEGDGITGGPLWQPLGVVARADSTFGERHDFGLQAPHFEKIDGKIWCIYNSNGARLMESADGKTFERARFNGKKDNLLFDKAGRDVMLFRDDDSLYYAYSTLTHASNDNFAQSFVQVRTSKNLRRWSDFSIVSSGGRGGNGPVSAESPFVVKMKGYYYLFRASSISFLTYVYRSETPFDFGVNTDAKLIATLPLKASELIKLDGQWYISDLADFYGIKMYKLDWEKDKTKTSTK
jgi:hypothetical protein